MSAHSEPVPRQLFLFKVLRTNLGEIFLGVMGSILQNGNPGHTLDCENKVKKNLHAMDDAFHGRRAVPNERKYLLESCQLDGHANMILHGNKKRLELFCMLSSAMQTFVKKDIPRDAKSVRVYVYEYLFLTSSRIMIGFDVLQKAHQSEFFDLTKHSKVIYIQLLHFAMIILREKIYWTVPCSEMNTDAATEWDMAQKMVNHLTEDISWDNAKKGNAASKEICYKWFDHGERSTWFSELPVLFQLSEALSTIRAGAGAKDPT